MNRKGEKFFQLDLEEVEGEESERETGKEWWRRSRRGTGSQGMDVEMTEIGEEIEPSLQSEKNEEEENPQQGFSFFLLCLFLSLCMAYLFGNE